MRFQTSRLAELLHLYSEGVCSDEQKMELMSMIRDTANAELLQALIEEYIREGKTDKHIEPLRAEEIFRKVTADGAPSLSRVKKIHSHRWLAAASVLLLVSASLYFYFSQRTKTRLSAYTTMPAASAKPILPASNKATLTLANGSVIPLDSVANTTLAAHENTGIIRLSDGRIVYQPGDNDTAASYNTIETPKGGLYEVVLADGTHVWLNAASKLRFPTVFTGSERKVELTGEAYFEVKKDISRPFVVSVRNSVITVLGTHFNVNAYNDEKDISATLLEGSVKFSRNNSAHVLLPGQQVVCGVTDNSMKIRNADIQQVMSWKNGFFEFENMQLPAIMRQIARWYDVELEYRGDYPGLALSGGISRKLSLQDLQKLMEANGVLFSVNGKKVIIGH